MQMIPLTESALASLERRGIDTELAAKLGVASCGMSRPSRHDWIAFPHYRRGEMVHWAARVVSEPKPDQWCTQQKGGDRCLWNVDVIYDETLIDAKAPLIITEGHIDALSIMSVGFAAVVSVPDGAPGKPSADPDLMATAKYAYLADVRDQIRKWSSVIIATDADQPGRALFDDLARIIGRSKCRILEYSDDCKDANDVLVKHGTEILVDAVQRARWAQVKGIYQLDTLPPMNIPVAVDCGIAGIDDLWRFRPGELSVLVGYPNSGKTLIVNQIALGLAQKHDWVVAFCSPEQHWPIHVDRLITAYLGKQPRIASEEEIERARKFIRSHVVWLIGDASERMTIEWLLEKEATVSWRYNVKFVALDPYNKLDHTVRPEAVSSTEYHGEMLNLIWNAGAECGVHNMVSAHPHKPVGHRDGSPPPPNGYAIDGSAHFVNRPDLGATLHRRKDNTLFWCWKARYSDGEWYDNGKCGHVKLGLNTLTRTFVKLPNQDDEEDQE